ncbi:MAG: hypothetical protein JWR38_4100 [Mucilaginibacter sp.]|nr:hypothetical protein [Mucilaginibacter sp.]
MAIGFEGKGPSAIIDQTKTTSHSLHCRRCKTSVSRIPRGPLVKFAFFWLPLKKYVCYRCHRKTYRWSSSSR